MARTEHAGGRFVRNVALLAGGTASAQVLVLATYPLLSRLYTPQDFGVLAVYVAVLGSVLPIASFRYEFAIPVADDEQTARSLLALCGILVPANAVLLGLVWAVTRALHADLGGVGQYLWLLPLGFLGGGLYQAFSYWAVRQRDFARLARTKVSQGAGTAVTQLALGLLSGPLGLLIGDVVGRTAGLLTLAKPVIGARSEGSPGWTRDRLASAARAYRRFPAYSAPSGLVNALGLQAPALLIVALFGVAAGGIFGFTQRVLGAPMALIGRGIVQVFFAEGAKLNRENPTELIRLFDRVAVRLLLVGGGATVFIALVSRPAFPAIFGEEWELAGVYAQGMSLMIGAQILVVPLSHTLNLVQRQDLQLLWDVVRLAAVLTVFGAAQAVGWTDVTTVWILSGVMAIAYLWLFWMSRRALRSREA